MATQQQLLQQLAQYDNDVLQRLLNYAPMIITPSSDILLSVTMDQLTNYTENVLIPQYWPAWTDFSTTDFGRFLVELFADFSEKDFWYINAFANEGFLSSASTYSNVYAHALSRSYFPVTEASATTIVALTFGVGQKATIAPGQIVLQTSTGSYQFYNRDPIVIPEITAGTLTVSLTFVEGSINTDTRNYNGRSVRITTPNIDPTSVMQTVNGVYWTLVNSFSQSTDSSTDFLVLPESDGSISVVYGTGGFGIQPTLNSPIVTTYRSCSGSAANNLAAGSLITVKTYPPQGNLTAINQVIASSGGTDAESMESIRNNCVVTQTLFEGIINSTDCTNVLNMWQNPKIYQSYAYSWMNALYFYVIPADGTIADQDYLDNLAAQVAPQVVMDHQIAGVPTVYVDLTGGVTGGLTITVYLLAQYSQAAVLAEVQAYLNQITDPLQQAKYNTSFTIGDIVEGIIANVAGVTNVVFNLVRNTLPVNLTPTPGQVTIIGGSITAALVFPNPNIVINLVGGSTP